MGTLSKIIGVAVLAIGGIAVIGILMAWPTEVLWNWLMPSLFHLPTIDFWQAMGLMVLSGILFKSSSSSSKD